MVWGFSLPYVYMYMYMYNRTPLHNMFRPCIPKSSGTWLVSFPRALAPGWSHSQELWHLAAWSHSQELWHLAGLIPKSSGTWLHGLIPKSSGTWLHGLIPKSSGTWLISFPCTGIGFLLFVSTHSQASVENAFFQAPMNEATGLMSSWSHSQTLEDVHVADAFTFC